MQLIRSLSQKYGIPVGALVGVSIVGLVGFWIVMAIAMYANLTTQWPEMSRAWAVVLAVLFPLVFLLGIGVWGAIQDKLAGHGGRFFRRG